MPTIQVHPIVAHLPSAEPIVADALLHDIQANGQHLPIVLFEGMIWDGRARYDACTDLGIKPWLVPLRQWDPMNYYIRFNYRRCGEPRSALRDAVVETLLPAGSAEERAKARARRAVWIKAARTEFENLVRARPEACAVCGQHIDFVHAHHSFPLTYQFECGVDEPIHDHRWLCPIHHKRTHVLLNGYLGSRDISFLDCIPDHLADEWLAIERVAREGIDLCCDALGRRSSNDRRRYDPEYGLFLLRNPSVSSKAIQWQQATGPSVSSVPRHDFG